MTQCSMLLNNEFSQILKFAAKILIYNGASFKRSIFHERYIPCYGFPASILTPFCVPPTTYCERFARYIRSNIHREGVRILLCNVATNSCCGTLQIRQPIRAPQSRSASNHLWVHGYASTFQKPSTLYNVLFKSGDRFFLCLVDSVLFYT